MANKPGRKDARTRTPTEKKKLKGLERVTPPVQEEAEQAPSSLLKVEEIQALVIRPEDLEKVHIPRPPREEQKPSITNRILVRKSLEREEGKKRQLLVARIAPPESAVKEPDFSGTEIPLCDTQGPIQPHCILGSLQDLKREALFRGNVQLAQLIQDSPRPNATTTTSAKHGVKQTVDQKNENGSVLQKQDNALSNWQYHMKLRKRLLDKLASQLNKPTSQLLMNVCEDVRRVQEEKYLIDRSIPAMEYGKGERVGSEFWNVSEYVGDELNGLLMTLTQAERGYSKPPTYIGKSRTIQQETGSADHPAFYHTWHKSLYLQRRRQELKEVMEELHFPKPDIDGLEVIGRGQTFTSISAEQFPGTQENEETTPEDKENQDPLSDFPDTMQEPFLGPSLIFCNQLAQWVEDSQSDKIGICTRITFEALAGDKASSVLEVVNNGTAVVWYEWRRLPNTSSLEGHRSETRVQHFYFNSSPGVILPGETKHFPFYFKSLSAGIFSENWEFCTHPVLLAGALLQVSLWGISLYEDKTAPQREQLQRELESREALAIAQQMVEELLNRVRSPERPPSPVPQATMEETFQQLNPKLHYKHQTVEKLQQLWKDYLNTPSAEDQIPTSGPTELLLNNITLETEKMEWAETEKLEAECDWTLSVLDLIQASNCIQNENKRETYLSQLNKTASELCTPTPGVAEPDLLHHACLQLWRKAMDELADRSLLLRSVLGMPDNDITVKSVLEEPVDAKRMKGGKEDKKGGGTKEDKRSPVGKERDEKKGGKTGGKGDKEDRPSSRKAKVKDEKKSGKMAAGLKETKELSPTDSLESSPTQSRSFLVDPLLQEKYQEYMYLEVYEILVSLVQNLVSVAEGLKPRECTLEEEILRCVS
ncbi:LOW QUALITY PROTEIN: MYCBP-associated protein [Bombina bombina]|uniref:LOW QUALITY PROTEIN: MYCBP-associated protein n=1 Tax=Bombina bombina TaxID=8345 RepID=UPI00235B143F|nr:LOW QUALITY PROTEIN: MYCBP-associated protein [Bombina bombina]